MKMKTCLPVEFGGCGETKSISAFLRDSKIRSDGTRGHRPRCKKCTSRYKKMSPEEKSALQKIPTKNGGIFTGYVVRFCQNKETISLLDIWQKSITTDCERNYHKIGLRL